VSTPQSASAAPALVGAAGAHNALAPADHSGGGAAGASAPHGLVESPFPDPDGFRDAVVIPVRNKAGLVVATTIVDADLYPALALCSWHLNERGYVARTFYLGNARQTLKLHRIVMCCSVGDGLEVDHVNRVKLDNRRANLRIATRAENMANVIWESQRPRPLQTEAGRPRWREKQQRWEASFNFRKVRHHVGTFRDYAEAEAALAEAKARVVGS